VDNTIFYVIGDTAATRLAVAEAIAAQTGARVVDAQAIYAPIFNVIDHSDPAAMPDAVWAQIDAVRDAVLATIETMSPKPWNFVFTHAGLAIPADVGVYRAVRGMAERRGARFQPAKLIGGGSKRALLTFDEPAVNVNVADKIPAEMAKAVVAAAGT
jgi:hypothetical protein